MLNAYHLVLDSGVTDRGLEMEVGGGGGGGGWMDGGGWWGGESEREEAVIQLKSRPTLVSQSLNLHIVM